jgi:hypothetical protein
MTVAEDSAEPEAACARWAGASTGPVIPGRAPAGGRRACPRVALTGDDPRRHAPAIRSDDRAVWRRVTIIEQSLPAGARLVVPRRENGVVSHGLNRRGKRQLCGVSRYRPAIKLGSVGGVTWQVE